jgi:hypothetical protein
LYTTTVEKNTESSLEVANENAGLSDGVAAFLEVTGKALTSESAGAETH